MSSPESFLIMVTDTNHHVRNFLQRELEKEGYTVCNLKTGDFVYDYLFSSAPLDLIILDPDLFHPFDQTLIGKIVHRRSSLQIIIHTYVDSLAGMKAGSNTHLVEKSGLSIGQLKAIIRKCFEQESPPVPR